MRVLLVGPYPPPYGGLAVQLCEWQRFLAQQVGYECVIMNIGEYRRASIPGCMSVSGYWDFVRKLHDFARRGYLVHLLTNGHNVKSWLCSLACALAGVCNHRRTVLVFGSGNAPDYVKNSGLLLGVLIRSVIRLGGRLVCRNEHMRQTLITYGAAPEKVAIVPGFLGLEVTEQESIPARLQKILNTQAPVLGATASLDPEYGIPLMLEAVKELRKIYPSIWLVIIGPGEEAKGRLSGCEAPDHAYFTGPLSHAVVLAVMKRLTLFLRPTYFDGDSLSVREALALGVPVVASATDFRPDGVITFRKGDLQDFLEKLRHAIEHAAELTAQVRQLDQCDNTTPLLNIYEDLTSGTSRVGKARANGVSTR